MGVRPPLWKRRINGYIPRLKGNKTPQNILIFDTESYIIQTSHVEVILPLRLGAAIFMSIGNNYYPRYTQKTRFSTSDEFIDLLRKYTRGKSKLYVFAHNIKHDIIALDLFDKFKELKIETEPPIINQKVFIWTVKSFGGTICFLDTANFGVTTVAELGETYGLNKGEPDFFNVSDDELYDYCLNDTTILQKFVLRYIRYIGENNLGSFRTTLPSQAFGAYRTRFMTNPPYTHTHPKVLKLEREAYKGGRVSAFRIGYYNTKPHYKVDVNSMYPHVMLTNYYPGKQRAYRKNPSVEDLKLALKKYYVIAKCKIEIFDQSIMVRYKDKLQAPEGSFTAALHLQEIKHVLKHGRIIEVLEMAIYDLTDLFSDYVKFFNEEKIKATEKGDKAWRGIVKLFLNSLYGKFGQLLVERRELEGAEHAGISRLTGKQYPSGFRWIETSWFGRRFYEVKGGETKFSCAAVAGAVTANARMLLHHYINLAGIENTYYTDTDSLIVSQTGFNKLAHVMHETRLGALALEGVEVSIQIYGSKAYRFGWNRVNKGVPITAPEIENGLFEYDQFMGFVTWLNHGADTPPKVTRSTRKRVQIYDKGIVLDNGVVMPHLLFHQTAQTH